MSLLKKPFRSALVKFNRILIITQDEINPRIERSCSPKMKKIPSIFQSLAEKSLGVIRSKGKGTNKD